MPCPIHLQPHEITMTNVSKTVQEVQPASYLPVFSTLITSLQFILQLFIIHNSKIMFNKYCQHIFDHDTTFYKTKNANYNTSFLQLLLNIFRIGMGYSSSYFIILSHRSSHPPEFIALQCHNPSSPPSE